MCPLDLSKLTHVPPTMAEVAAERVGKPISKPVPHILAKQVRQQTKAEAELAFRAAVRARDGNRSRASGVFVNPRAMNWDRRAEVHHVLKRSTHPEERLNVENGITLTRTEHALAEARCPNAPDHFLLEIAGPADLGQPQRFTWRDQDGRITKERRG